MNMKTWLHRIAYHSEVAEPLLEKGYLSIGFSELSDAMFITDISSMYGLQSFEEYFLAWKGMKPDNRFNLWRFITQMKKGDHIIVPGWRTFSVYELTEDSARPISEVERDEMTEVLGTSISLEDDGLLYRNDYSLIDLGFVRKVKPIQKNIPISEYADPELTARLKLFSINNDLSDYQENITRAIQNYKKSEVQNLMGECASSISYQLLKTIRQEFTSEKFKDFIKLFFLKLGASDAYIPSKDERENHPETDIVAVFEPLKYVIYAKVKFGPENPNQWLLRQFEMIKDSKENMNDGYNKVFWFITSEEFSPNVYQQAKELHVQMIDGLEFSKMLLENGITNIDTWIHSSLQLCTNPMNN